MGRVHKTMNIRMTMTDRTDPLPTWLAAQAESLDAQAALAPELLPRLARAGWLGCGVPREWGGQGGSVWEAVEGIADVGRLAAFGPILEDAQRLRDLRRHPSLNKSGVEHFGRPATLP